MTEQEVTRRYDKAIAMAALLRASEFSSQSVAMFDHKQWHMAAEGAQVIPPSATTRILVVDILRKLEGAEFKHNALVERLRTQFSCAPVAKIAGKNERTAYD